MVTDKMYLGHMVQGRWRKLSYNSKKLIELPESEWFIVENTHPPIVSQELFDLVQKKLEKNVRNKEKVIGEKKYLFQGLLKCKECGHKISITSKKVKYGFTYWTVCSHYAKYSKYERCTSHRMNYSYLEEDLLHYFKKIGEMFLKDINQDEWIKESIKIQKNDLLHAEKELEQVKRNTNKIQDVISRLYEDRLNEVISVKQYSLMVKKYDQQIIDLEAKEEELNDKVSQLKNDDSINSYEECKKMMEEYMKFEHPTIELMNQIVDMILVDKDNNVEVYFKADVGKYINLVVDKDETL